MKPIYVIINVVLTIIAIIAAWVSPAPTEDKILLTVFFSFIIIFWCSTLSMKWIKWVLGVKE